MTRVVIRTLVELGRVLAGSALKTLADPGGLGGTAAVGFVNSGFAGTITDIGMPAGSAVPIWVVVTVVMLILFFNQPKSVLSIERKGRTCVERSEYSFPFFIYYILSDEHCSKQGRAMPAAVVSCYPPHSAGSTTL